MQAVRAELPRMNPSRCTGCGDCLAICPTRCLVPIHGLPVLTSAIACIRCEACQIVCLPQAIEWKHPSDIPS